MSLKINPESVLNLQIMAVYSTVARWWQGVRCIMSWVWLSVGYTLTRLSPSSIILQQCKIQYGNSRLWKRRGLLSYYTGVKV